MVAIDAVKLKEKLDIENGIINGKDITKRYLSDLEGCFADVDAYRSAVKGDDSLIYWVEGASPADGDGDMHYGIGTIAPGKIGDEYYMTKGHYHSWREAAEIYIGLQGKGVMLLEDEESGKSKMVTLEENSVVYVPGHTAHRTMNTGDDKLVYIGIYPAKAGHDYGAIAANNFKYKVIEGPDGPQLVERN